MNHDAYAGFLKLLITPATRAPKMTADVEAYLRYANEREPISADVFGAPVRTFGQAA